MNFLKPDFYLSKQSKKAAFYTSKIQKSFLFIARNSELSSEDVNFICSEFVRIGYLQNFILADSIQNVKAIDYFVNFYDPLKSDFLKEKERSRKPVCKSTLANNRGIVKNYWAPFLQQKYLAEFTKQDLREFVNSLQDNQSISEVTKKAIVSTGFKVFRWAFKTDLLEKDITAGIKNFSSFTNERQILTPEIVQKLFASEWDNPVYKLANLLSCCTGLRAGEIVALQSQDLDFDHSCINLQHSWSNYDGLKSTKTRVSRTVYVYEPKLLSLLKENASENPWQNGYIFWSPSHSRKPLRTETLLKALKKELVKIGIPQDVARRMTFHSWRHYHDTYLHGQVSLRLLQAQSGHSKAMIENLYANHSRNTDAAELFQAQKKVFGTIVQEFFNSQVSSI